MICIQCYRQKKQYQKMADSGCYGCGCILPIGADIRCGVYIGSVV